MNSAELTVADPVCKMELRPAEVRESVIFDGERYFFCSIGCRAEFQRHPQDYIKRESAEEKHV